MAFKLNRPLFHDASKTRVLEEGDPAAAFVIGGKGSTLTDEQAKAFGLGEEHRLKEGEVVEGEKAADEEAEGEAPATTDGEGESLESMTKAELLELAEAQGIETKSNWNKAQIIEALEAQ